MSKFSPLLLAGLLVGANALAADNPPGTTTITTTTPSADLDAQLLAARQKLEAAARDVARLSSQLGQTAMAKVQTLRARAVLGLVVLTDPSPKEQGAVIMRVSPAGPAAEAGLLGGDIIVGLNGAPISGPNAPREVVELMANVKPDTKVTVKVLRDGKPKEFQVTPRANVAYFFPGFDGPGPVWRTQGPQDPQPQVFAFANISGDGAIFEGMELAELSPALGQYFGTSKGVLVVRVPHEGDFLKLQDGDVILSIDGRVPENGSHATRILRSYQPGEKIQLKIMRQKKSLDLEGTLPDQRRDFKLRRIRERGPGEPPSGDHPPTDQG
jgi:S1-C subfamily serine protease